MIAYQAPTCCMQQESDARGRKRARDSLSPCPRSLRHSSSGSHAKRRRSAGTTDSDGCADSGSASSRSWQPPSGSRERSRRSERSQRSTGRHSGQSLELPGYTPVPRQAYHVPMQGHRTGRRDDPMDTLGRRVPQWGQQRYRT